MTKGQEIIAALEREIQGYSKAAQAKGLNPDNVQIIVRLKSALAKVKAA
jgi:hypothetical protein